MASYEICWWKSVLKLWKWKLAQLKILSFLRVEIEDDWKLICQNFKCGTSKPRNGPFFQKMQKVIWIFFLKNKFYGIVIWQNFFITFIKLQWEPCEKNLSNWIFSIFSNLVFGKIKKVYCQFLSMQCNQCSGHFWNFKGLNLKFGHPNYQTHQICTLRNDGIKSLISYIKIHWNLLSRTEHSDW